MHDNVATGNFHQASEALAASSFGTEAHEASFHRLHRSQFVQMQQVYGRAGGLLSGSEAAYSMRRHREQLHSDLWAGGGRLRRGSHRASRPSGVATVASEP
jgi:hypothetical protein